MRKVMVSKYKEQPDGKWKFEEDGEALFHRFGTAFEELRDGVAIYSTAIIERSDGTIENLAVESVRFLNAP